MNEILVIIPVKNEEEKIEQCLSSLNPHKPYEVIVVDGHSTDKTAGNAEGDYVAFIDADCGGIYK
jgi:glycosyltransferase involved in cell wall biosynthesis